MQKVCISLQIHLNGRISNVLSCYKYDSFSMAFEYVPSWKQDFSHLYYFKHYLRCCKGYILTSTRKTNNTCNFFYQGKAEDFIKLIEHDCAYYSRICMILWSISVKSRRDYFICMTLYSILQSFYWICMMWYYYRFNEFLFLYHVGVWCHPFYGRSSWRWWRFIIFRRYVIVSCTDC